MTINLAVEKRDFKRIEKLNKLTDKKTFWSDVKKLVGGASDHALSRWQCLAEARYEELGE